MRRLLRHDPFRGRGGRARCCSSSAIPIGYRLWRNTLAFATGLALIGFSFFPVLPPRLLPPGYGFVDTLQVVGGLWNFSSGPVNDVSNQYAAMPSLHTAWSAWCALALIPLIRPWWGKVLVLLYPLATIFCIIVTANHYFADVTGGPRSCSACPTCWHVVLTVRLDRWYATGRAHRGRRRRGAGSQPEGRDPYTRPGRAARGRWPNRLGWLKRRLDRLLEPEIERWAAVDPDCALR